MSNKALIDKIKSLFSSFEQAAELQTSRLQNGKTIQYSNLETGGAISIVAEDGTATTAEPGQYPLEDGRLVIVVEVGKISEVKQATEGTEDKAEMSEPTPTLVDWTPQINELKSQVEQYVKRITALEGANTKFGAAFTETLALIESMGSEPDGEPIQAPRQSVFSETKKQGRAQRFDRLKQALH